MDDHVRRRPGEVNFQDGNTEVAWTRFKQKFEMYLIGMGKEDAAPKVKWALMMREEGDKALEVYNFFKAKLVTYKKNEAGEDVIDEDNSQNYDKVIEHFHQYSSER
ncbi:Putative cysteine ligase BshC [Frankliniella fusca]|uniref:Cysteine ligase BshC n=1 Tax=Frankliniella fusca TaxID=407009 RepID=A0AAE1LT09_9NEOP|nr:Putative cysteine ligase BshC [Frankliniella fusca]